jgi:predicted nucleotidyltransferase
MTREPADPHALPDDLPVPEDDGAADHLPGAVLPSIALQGPAQAMSMRGQLGPQARELRRCRRRLLDAADAHGVGKMRVFGSLARGQAGTASDVDLLIDLKAGRTLLDLAAFRREATEILDMPVDVATEDMLKDRIRDRVLAEALPL